MRRLFMDLLQNLEIVQNGQYRTDGEVQADQTADSTDDSANQRNVGQNADQHTRNSILCRLLQYRTKLFDFR